MRKASAIPGRRPTISVLLVDDHPVVREGLRAVLERQQGIRVVGTAASGNAAIEQAARLKPHVIVMDISMPGINGIEATRLVRLGAPEAAVLVLSTYSVPAVMRRAVEAGARGYISKEAEVTEIVQAIRAVAAGGRYFDVRLAKFGADLQPPTFAASRPAEALTTTETNIVRLVAEGNSNPQVAAVLGLSPRTVETYRLRLMRKLGLDNLPALVRYAIRKGIVGLE